VASVVVAVDPGGTTGIALWTPPMGLSLKEVRGGDKAVDWLADIARQVGHAHFVVERYIITPATAKMSQQHDALEIIGALKFLIRKYGHTLTMQTPAEAKAFSTDKKLKNVGWYQPGQGHARDASRHALLFLAKQGIIDLHTLLGGGNADL
jgi:hypothetical protein